MSYPSDADAEVKSPQSPPLGAGCWLCVVGANSENSENRAPEEVDWGWVCCTLLVDKGEEELPAIGGGANFGAAVPPGGGGKAPIEPPAETFNENNMRFILMLIGA
jgi:hypothetical protein